MRSRPPERLTLLEVLEWLCGQLMNALGIATAETQIATFGDSKALVVTRFDRRWQGVPEGGEQRARFKPLEGSWIARLPQEDLCLPPGSSNEPR